MIDHVGIRLPSLAEGERFYGRAFELLDYPGERDGRRRLRGVERLRDRRGDRERPVTRRLHVGFYAPSREAVDAWWRALTDAGYESDGAPGPRPAYGPDYYGAFVLDPAGNSIEAVNNGPRRQPGVIDHLWLRTRSLEDATRFYEAVCPAVNHTVERYDGRTQIRGSGATFSIVEGPPTENLHLAFAGTGSGDGRRLPRGRRRGGLRVERRARRAARVPPGLLRRLPDRPRRQQHRGRLPRPLTAPVGRATARRRGACGGRACRRRASRRRSRARSRAGGRRTARPRLEEDEVDRDRVAIREDDDQHVERDRRRG